MSKNRRPRLGDRCRDNGDGFAPGARSDMELDNLLDRPGTKSLSQLVKKR